jgi:hypothetical protein
LYHPYHEWLALPVSSASDKAYLQQGYAEIFLANLCASHINKKESVEREMI